MLYFYNMSREDEEELVYKALADGRRRKMLDLLQRERMSTSDLASHFPHLDRCTVMQHLGVLEEAGLIIAKREGRERWNHLNPLPIRDIHERWIGPYAAYAVEKLAALKSGLES